jgi:hypothetical protein
MKTATTKISSSDIAKKIYETCEQLGWKYQVRGQILTIIKEIFPNNNSDFCRADSEYYDILSLLPRTSPGSDWGTDGGGIGALSAMKNGLFVMNRSGGSLRILKALAKM